MKDDLVDVRYSDQGKKNDWTQRLKRYVNLVEYTDDQTLNHIVEPHKTYIYQIKEKVRSQAKKMI